MSENEVLSQWLDAEELRSLAEGLLARPPVSEVASPESFLGDSFEGFDGAARSEEVVPVASIPKKAPLQSTEASVIMPHPVGPSQSVPSISPEPVSAEPPVQTSPFQKKENPSVRMGQTVSNPVIKPSSGSPSLPLALQIFEGWLKKQAPIQAAFVCDPEGKTAFDEIGSEKLVKVARSLANASLTQGETRSMPIKISEERVMEILALKFEDEYSIAGLVVAKPLSSEALAMVRRSFETSLERSSAPRQ